jgi:hypothetical protein
MIDSELSALPPLLAAAIVQALVAAGLHAWARWVARRQQGPWWRRASWLPWIGLTVGVVGVGLTIVFLIQAFGAVADVTPADRAQALSEAIARAMVATAIGAPTSWALSLASVIVSLVGTLRRPAPDGARRLGG